MSHRFAAVSGGGAFGRLGPEALVRLAADSRIVRVPAGRTIFRKGDPADGCYVILEGAVKITAPASGRHEAILAILGKGDVVGEMALIDGQPRSATVTAAKPSELCYLNTAAFGRLAQTELEVARQLLRVIAARLRVGNDAYVQQQMPLRARLAGALLRLAHGFGERLPDQRVLIRQKVSQADLGHMVGATRENVNRQLSEWSRARLLTRISGYYCLENPSAFEALVLGDAAA